MSKVYVMFKTKAKTEVVTAFSSEQDPSTWPDLVAIDSDDPRFVAFLSAVQSPPQAWPVDET